MNQWVLLPNTATKQQWTKLPHQMASGSWQEFALWAVHNVGNKEEKNIIEQKNVDLRIFLPDTVSGIQGSWISMNPKARMNCNENIGTFVILVQFNKFQYVFLLKNERVQEQ